MTTPLSSFLAQCSQMTRPPFRNLRQEDAKLQAQKEHGVNIGAINTLGASVPWLKQSTQQIQLLAPYTWMRLCSRGRSHLVHKNISTFADESCLHAKHSDRSSSLRNHLTE